MGKPRIIKHMSENKFYSKFEKKTEPFSSKNQKKNKNDEKNVSKFEKKVFAHNVSSKSSKKTQTSSLKYEKTSLFGTTNLDKLSLEILNNFDKIIQGVRPLNSKQLQQLPQNIKALSHQLTDERSTRRLGYMNDTIQLSSYVRYYTWWNLVRLTRLFSNLPSSVFPKKDCTCLDLGSGPLTVVTALWLSRPELREKKLTWYCLDVSSNSLSLGEDIYLSVAAKYAKEAWKIIRVKGSFGTSIKQKCNFITSANMLNELDQATTLPPEHQTKKYFEQFLSYATNDASFLLVEPGVPKAARTLSLLRDRFISKEKTILSPCPHALECPMNGFKAYTGSSHKWCNFSFSTTDAPERLLSLSQNAKLSKDRATLSFICATASASASTSPQAPFDDDLSIRINSDPFYLPQGKTGFYGCSPYGLTLVSVSNKQENTFTSGDLIKIKNYKNTQKKDLKTDATVIEL